MDYTVKQIIDKLMELCDGNLDMQVKGIRQVNCPHEIGSMFHWHNIGIEKIKGKDFYGNEIDIIEIVSGGNNI